MSPAGWGVPALIHAVAQGVQPKRSELTRSRGEEEVTTPCLRVPSDPTAWPKAPRLRRTSPISKFAAAAALEALGPERLAASRAEELRVGVVFTLLNGSVNYTNRFFLEVLDNPATASPILFPETVFNAPSSHLSALIGSTAPNDTLIADSSGFFCGLNLAVERIQHGEVDACLVVCAEEIDWLSAEALMLHSSGYLPSEGAAAVLLEPQGHGPRLLELPDPVSLATHSPSEACAKIRQLLGGSTEHSALLVDSRVGVDRSDAPETAVWQDWLDLRWSPKQILGESLGAGSGWQVVTAVEAICQNIASEAWIVAHGGNQQAAGLRIGKSSS